MALPQPSDEQKEILIYFKQGYNCKIEAVAGAGKSTTLLLLALEAKINFKAKVLILTYNRDLKDEINEKIAILGLHTHCDIYTYHGYASRIYKQNIYNDIKLRECLTKPVGPAPYDIILLDEVQDMNEDYYRLVCNMLTRGKILVLVGDRRQCINEYLGATSEYLINYSKYFDTGRPWKELMLRKSYRVTPAIAKFVNDNVLCQDIIIPGNTKDRNCKPIYSHGVWDMERLVLRSVETYGAEEVVIMLPSVRNINPKSPVGKLCAKRQSGLLFCVRETDMASETMKGKVLITSYNSMKGRERKCVVLVGFDESYFEYYDKKWNKEEPTLPNILYVAATRAREQLILIQDDRKPRLRTISLEKLYGTCEVRGGQETKKLKDNNFESGKTYIVTDLTRHRNTTDTIELMDLIQIENIQGAGEALPYQNIIQFGGYYEDMRQYYGTLIPLLAQYRKTRKIDWSVYDQEPNKKDNVNIEILRKYNGLLIKETKDLKEWMELVVLQAAITSNCYFYVYQITNYDWVDVNFINTQVDRILTKLDNGTEGIFEYPCLVKNTQWSLHGYFDYFDEEKIWEFKCATTLSDDHKMQCGAYVSMYYENTGKLVPCNLYNTRTGELIKITVNNPSKYLEIMMRKRVSSIKETPSTLDTTVKPVNEIEKNPIEGVLFMLKGLVLS